MESTDTQASRPTIALVACAKRKLARPAAARELYASPLFSLVRDHVEQSYRRWQIVSAGHGLVDPTDVLEPYDLSLTELTAAEQAAWGRRGASQLIATHGAAARFDVYAGARYRRHLVPHLRRAGAAVVVPLARLRIGQQLAWLRQLALTRRGGAARPGRLGGEIGHGEPARAPRGRRPDPT